MSLSREAIVEGLRRIVGPEAVVTDERVLVESSVDNFRKLQNIFDVHTMPVPAAVALPADAAQVAELLRFASDNGVSVIPRTGGTATEGGLESAVPDSVIIDGSMMNEIIGVDPYNMQATCQCGVPLQALEDRAREHGLTTGHSPQSKPVAHMGGLVATRSIGQFSTLYGGIEDMVVGLEAVFPNGEIARIKNVPRRAAGPDIRHVVIGNEGALCFISEVTVKLFPYFPENNTFLGWTLKDMATGFAVLREVMVNGYKPSVARVYDPGDAGIHFSHFAAEDDCVLLFMAEGAAGIAKATADGIQEIVDKHPECTQVPSEYIETWFNDLCWDASKITAEDERIRQTRNVNRTTEISADWSSINDIYQTAKARIIAEIPDITMMGGHSSHSYINGTNMYFNYFFNVVGVGPEEETEKYYLPIIGIICEETLKRGGFDRPPPRHGQGACAVGQGRVRFVLLHPRDAQAVVRPRRHHEPGDDHPAVSGRRVRRRRSDVERGAWTCGSSSASRSRRTTRRCARPTGRGRRRRGRPGPRPATSAASSTSSTRPRWSSRCACATRARSAASRRASRRSPSPAARPTRSSRPCRRSASSAPPASTPARTSTSPPPRRPRWSPPARSGSAATSCSSAPAAAPATAAWSRSWSPRPSAVRV